MTTSRNIRIRSDNTPLILEAVKIIVIKNHIMKIMMIKVKIIIIIISNLMHKIPIQFPTILDYSLPSL